MENTGGWRAVWGKHCGTKAMHPLRATAITYDPHGWVSDLTCVTVSGTGSALSVTLSVGCVAYILMICHDVMCFIFQSQGQLPVYIMK